MIFAVAINPGGLRAISPVVDQIPDAQLYILDSLEPLCTDSRASRHQLFHHTDRQAVEALVQQHRPHLILTASSVRHTQGGQIENWFRQCARVLHIPSVCVLDHWCNYQMRFTSDDAHPFDSLPDLLCVMDARARRELIAAGFPAPRLVITGQPAFDRLFHESGPQRTGWRREARAQWGIADTTFVCGFISEPVAADCGQARRYTETAVAGDIARALAAVPGSVLVCKPHPREGIGKYTQLGLREPAALPPHTFVAACDAVVGMTSVLLLESLLLGTPTISFQPDSQAGDPWTHFIHPVPLVREVTALRSWLRAVRHGEHHAAAAPFYQERAATRNVVEVILQQVRR